MFQMTGQKNTRPMTAEKGKRERDTAGKPGQKQTQGWFRGCSVGPRVVLRIE